MNKAVKDIKNFFMPDIVITKNDSNNKNKVDFMLIMQFLLFTQLMKNVIIFLSEGILCATKPENLGILAYNKRQEKSYDCSYKCKFM